jgi:hemoglobin
MMLPDTSSGTTFDVRVRGRSPAFLALATAFHRRWLQDPVLAHPFSHPGTPQHIERLADY